MTLTNTGTADTAPTSPPGHRQTDMPLGFSITHVQSGNRLVYSDVVLLGQTVRLDTSDGSVLLEGYADRSAQTHRPRMDPAGQKVGRARGSSKQLAPPVHSSWWK